MIPDFNHIQPEVVIAQLLVIFVAIGLHEYAHCVFADMAGDPTPRYYGRVTLNLFKHFDPIGSIFILITTLTGFGLGWGRPAPMNPSKMRNPRWDFFIAVIAGPLCNVLQAVVYAVALRVAMRTGILVATGSATKFILMVLTFGVITNLALAIFNLIPIGPLDGQWILGLLMPERLRVKWFRFNRQMGLIGLVGVIFLMQSGHFDFIFAPLDTAFTFLTGMH